MTGALPDNVSNKGLPFLPPILPGSPLKIIHDKAASTSIIPRLTPRAIIYIFHGVLCISAVITAMPIAQPVRQPAAIGRMLFTIPLAKPTPLPDSVWVMYKRMAKANTANMIAGIR
jgi:hypothetical protein